MLMLKWIFSFMCPMYNKEFPRERRFSDLRQGWSIRMYLDEQFHLGRGSMELFKVIYFGSFYRTLIRASRLLGIFHIREHRPRYPWLF
jgi:hypothetical protein